LKGMLRYIIIKVTYTLITIILIVAFTFFLFYIMPGDPSTILLGKTGFGRLTPGHGSEATSLVQFIREFYGLDRPLYEQFLLHLWHFFTGNWGTSITVHPGASVSDIILYPLLNTIFLCGIATLICAYIGIKIGSFSAWNRGKLSDVALTGISLTLYSVPSFWLGILLLLLFAVWIPIFPLGHAGGEGPNLLMAIMDKIHHLILPLVTYVLTDFAAFSLTMKSSLTDVLTEDYIVTAKAKGLNQPKIHKKHAMPNAMLPMITVIAYQLGYVLMGAIVIETVFSYPGIGLLTYDALIKRDYPLLMALFLIISTGMVIANAIADILYRYFDPRVKV